jgi:flagellar hook protein FlgE
VGAPNLKGTLPENIVVNRTGNLRWIYANGAFGSADLQAFTFEIPAGLSQTAPGIFQETAASGGALDADFLSASTKEANAALFQGFVRETEGLERVRTYLPLKLSKGKNYTMSAVFAAGTTPSAADVFEIRDLSALAAGTSGSTTSKLDLAVEGKGFLRVKAPESGRVFCAKSGSFSVDTELDWLTNYRTPSGYLVTKKGCQLQGAIGAKFTCVFDESKAPQPGAGAGENLITVLPSAITFTDVAGTAGSAELRFGSYLNLSAGSPVTGPGIPADTVITSIDFSSRRLYLSRPLTRAVSNTDTLYATTTALSSTSLILTIAPDFRLPSLSVGQYLTGPGLSPETRIMSVAGTLKGGTLFASVSTKTLDKSVPGIRLPESVASQLSVGDPVSVKGFAAPSFVKSKSAPEDGSVLVMLGSIGGAGSLYGEDLHPAEDSFAEVPYAYGQQTVVVNKFPTCDSYDALPFLLANAYTAPVVQAGEAYRFSGPSDNYVATIPARTVTSSGWTAGTGQSVLTGGDVTSLRAGMWVSGPGLPYYSTFIQSVSPASKSVTLSQKTTIPISTSTPLRFTDKVIDSKSVTLTLPADYRRPLISKGTVISGDRFRYGTAVESCAGNYKTTIPKAAAAVSGIANSPGAADGVVTITASSPSSANSITAGMVVSAPGSPLDGLVLKAVESAATPESVKATLADASGTPKPLAAFSGAIQVSGPKTLDKSFPGIKTANVSGITAGMSVSGPGIPSGAMVKSVGAAGTDGMRAVYLCRTDAPSIDVFPETDSYDAVPLAFGDETLVLNSRPFVDAYETVKFSIGNSHKPSTAVGSISTKFSESENYEYVDPQGAKLSGIALAKARMFAPSVSSMDVAPDGGVNLTLSNGQVLEVAKVLLHDLFNPGALISEGDELFSNIEEAIMYNGLWQRENIPNLWPKTDGLGSIQTRTLTRFNVPIGEDMAPEVAAIKPLIQTATAGGQRTATATWTATQDLPWARFGMRFNRQVASSLVEVGNITLKETVSGNLLTPALNSPRILTQWVWDSFETQKSRTVSSDKTAPVVAYTSPAEGSRVASAALTFSGTVSEAGGKPLLEYRLGSGPWIGIALTGASSPYTWSQSVSLAVGANTFEVRATDTSLNVSSTASRSVAYLLPTTLSVVLPAGEDGSVSAGFGGESTRVLGASYSVTATPAPGMVFQKWLKNGVQVSTNATLAFAMEANLTLTPVFAPNFKLLAGDYNGLVGSGSIGSGGAADLQAFPNGNGFLRLTTTTDGSLSGILRIEGAGHPFSGRILADKTAAITIARPGKPAAKANFKLASAPPGEIAGTVTTDGAPLAFRALRGAYASSGAHPLGGQTYTMLLPAPAELKAGHGYASLALESDGSAVLSGELPTSSTFIAQARVVDDGNGNWVFPAYAGANSLLTGELIIPKIPKAGDLELKGSLEWLRKPQSGAPLYPGGFLKRISPAGARLRTTSATNVLGGGPAAPGFTLTLDPSRNTLPEAVSQRGTWPLDNRPAFGSPVKNNLTLRFNPISGIFEGSLKRAAGDIAADTRFRGAVFSQPVSPGGGRPPVRGAGFLETNTATAPVEITTP